MATLAELHDGLETRLQTISGLRVRDHIPEQIEPPMAVVVFADSDFHEAMQNGLRIFRFAVVVFVGRSNARSAQKQLLEYADTTGSSSIKAAIEGDRDLGGLANTDVHVLDVEAFDLVEVGAVPLVSLRFNVLIYSR